MSNNNINDRFDKLEDRLIEEFREQKKQLDDINQTLTRNTVSLEEHMRRTALLEDRIIPLEETNNIIKFGTRAIFWFCGILATVITAAFALYEQGFFKSK